MLSFGARCQSIEEPIMRIPGGKISFTYEWESTDEDTDSIILDVTVTISDYFPGSFYKNNGDPGDPPDGGEVEDMTVILPDNTAMKHIPDELYDRLCETSVQRFFGD
jgi:hypothetical protein